MSIHSLHFEKDRPMLRLFESTPTRPIADNDSDLGRALNRRIEAAGLLQ